MSDLKNFPRAEKVNVDGIVIGSDIINLPPTGSTVSKSASSAATLAALLGAGLGSLAVTFTTEKIVHIKAGSYPIVWRWRYSETDGITNLAGAKPYDDTIPAGADTWRAVPATATGIVLDYLTVDPAITVIGK